MGRNKKLEIPTDQHVFVAGRTGSGKSFLTQTYLAGYDYVVALDIKGNLSWPAVPGTIWNEKTGELLEAGKNLTLVTRLADIPKAKTNKIVYRPDWDEINFDTINQFFEWIYNRQNCIVWVDEVMGEAVCANPYRIPPYYKAILTRGRSRNTAAWSVSQRPSGIHPIVMSEASHYFMFALNLSTDRSKVANITGYNEFETNPPKFGFWYLNITQDDAIPKLARLKR